MTHYYDYIVAGRLVDQSAEVFKVGIGTSKQAQRDFLTLTAISVDRNHYFHIHDDKSCDFVMRVRQSVEGVLLPSTLCAARDLVRYLKKGVPVPRVTDVLRSSHHQNTLLSLNYRISNSLATRQ